MALSPLIFILFLLSVMLGTLTPDATQIWISGVLEFLILFSLTLLVKNLTLLTSPSFMIMLVLLVVGILPSSKATLTMRPLENLATRRKKKAQLPEPTSSMNINLTLFWIGVDSSNFLSIIFVLRSIYYDSIHGIQIWLKAGILLNISFNLNYSTDSSNSLIEWFREMIVDLFSRLKRFLKFEKFVIKMRKCLIPAQETTVLKPSKELFN